MITSQTAVAVESEIFPLKRTLLGKAGANTGDAPTKKDLLAALGQSSEGDVVGATDKAARALSQVDGGTEAEAVQQTFADFVIPFLRPWRQDGQGVTQRDGTAVEASGAATQGELGGDGRFPAAGRGLGDFEAASATSPLTELSVGRLNSQMLAVLLQHQAA